MGGTATEPPANPDVQTFGDYLGRVIRITVSWSILPNGSGEHAITGVTVFRDAGCLFRKLFIGKGDDGTPDSTDKIVNVPVGTTILSAAQLNNLANRGVATIEDYKALQISVGDPTP